MNLWAIVTPLPPVMPSNLLSSSSMSSVNISCRNPVIRLTGSREKQLQQFGICISIGTTRKMGTVIITMRDRSKNRKPLQRGRNLSIEAIHTIQSLKRAALDHCNDHDSVDRVLASKFKRLLKLDMMAVLRELLRQNLCLLALKVFEDVQNEYWHKPQVSLYAEIISVLGSNGLYESVDLLFTELKMEAGLELDTDGFNVLLENLMSFNMTELAMECFYLMKSLRCELDKSSFRILINGLESKGEASLSAIVRQEAEKYYGKCLEFLEEKEELDFGRAYGNFGRGYDNFGKRMHYPPYYNH